MKDAVLILMLTTLAAFIIRLSRPKKKFRTQLVFTTIINKNQIKILSMQLNIKEFVNATLALVNHETQEPIEATFSNIEMSSLDTNIFTTDTDVNNDGIQDIVGVTEGTSTLNVKADASYTDPNTQQPVTESKEANLVVTITAPPPGAIKTDLIVSLSAPQPTP